MLCQFDKLLYPRIADASTVDYMIAVYRPLEILHDGSGHAMSQFKAVGYCLPITEKARFRLNGHWVRHPKHGLQFEVESYEEVISHTKEGIIGYVTKDLQSAIVNIQSREGVSLKDWGGTSDGRFAATYSLMKDDTDAQDESGSSSLDKSEVKIGNYVYFGSCEQDNRSDTGKEPIEWRVLALDKSGEKALLVSRYALTARCYHNGDTYPTWADSDIRGWLNGEFLQDAFTEQEQTIIQQTKLSTPSYEGIDGGSDTWDKVFLLSRGEAADYFTGSADRLVKPTAYARAMGADVAGENGCCWWWLRTPGTYSYDAGLVYAVGGIDHTGGNVKNAAIAVRPALWVELSG